MEDQKQKKKINKRKKISSHLKENIIIISDKEKTVDSGEETNKQKITDNLDIIDITNKICDINVFINSKKRTEISSACISNIDIIDDKDKSPISDEPFFKFKNSKNEFINSDYYQNNIKKKEKRKQYNENYKVKIILITFTFFKFFLKPPNPQPNCVFSAVPRIFLKLKKHSCRTFF